MYVAMYNLPTECMIACTYVCMWRGQCGVEWGWWGELTLHWCIANTPPVDVMCLFVVGCASDAVHMFMYILSTSLARCSESLTCIPAFRVATISETVCSTVPMCDLLVICGGVEGPGVLFVLYHRIALSDNVRFVMKVESTICALPQEI